MALWGMALLAATPQVQSNEIKAVVSDTNAVPYAMFSQDGSLSGGISKQLIDEIGKITTLPVVYLPLARARVESWIATGKADLGCFISPEWVSKPKELEWVGPLFYSAQYIVRRSDSKPNRQLSDLFHKRIGTIRGFVYPELEQAFAEELLVRDDAHSLESNLTRLAQGRLDAVMTVDLSYGYVMTRQKFDTSLTYDPLWTKAPAVYCALSPKSSHLAAIKQAFDEVQQQQFVEKIIRPYLPEHNSG
ncbi:ABC transporter substrate-binding protein [Rheinheimera sp.]|uniref:substrate-binding periplasmic protein n=1 Tax=Rheinheimera sp. TaxID=1869214 RepID=UPI0027BAA0B7|nr:transporter substrate-binding domain-containing protein [Rheinheimera sp.]